MVQVSRILTTNHFTLISAKSTSSSSSSMMLSPSSPSLPSPCTNIETEIFEHILYAEVDYMSQTSEMLIFCIVKNNIVNEQQYQLYPQLAVSPQNPPMFQNVTQNISCSRSTVIMQLISKDNCTMATSMYSMGKILACNLYSWTTPLPRSKRILTSLAARLNWIRMTFHRCQPVSVTEFSCFNSSAIVIEVVQSIERSSNVIFYNIPIDQQGDQTYLMNILSKLIIMTILPFQTFKFLVSGELPWKQW